MRLLQHSEVEEIAEPFKEGQRGSSAMPHKKNPVVSENICGLARLMRSYVSAALENIPLWHERDISHSSVERVILPDATCVAYYVLNKCGWIVENWQVNVDKMRENVRADEGLMASSRLLTALKMKGIDDDDIYKRVQAHALAARLSPPNLRERVMGDTGIMTSVGDMIEDLFDDESVLKRAEIPFERVKLRE